MAIIKKFNHLSALEYLLKLDTNVFKEELYYPWYAHRLHIQIISILWIASLLLFTIAMLVFTPFGLFIPLITAFVLTVLFIGGYFILISQSKERAKKACLKKVRVLEKKQFMKHIEPFVADRQRESVKRISNLIDFSLDEYIEIVISAKTRAILHTDAFIKDIERMLSEKRLTPCGFDDEGSCETTFKVPESAKQNYEKMKNRSTFNDELHITPQIQAGIVAKVKEAANRKALGREL